MVEWGAELPTLLAIQESTGVTPKALETKVDLRPDCAGYYEAFSILSLTRRYNQAGVQPLQMSEITTYLNEVQLRSTEREVYLHLILKMDAEFMRTTFEKKLPESGT